MPHDPRRQPTDGARLFRLFQTVSNQGETDKLLITMMKLPSVSLFHRFGERCPRNFKWGPAADQNSRRPIPSKP